MGKKNQVKYKKAPQAPRRFKSSYMFFSTEKHSLIRQELAEKGGTEKVQLSIYCDLVIGYCELIERNLTLYRRASIGKFVSLAIYNRCGEVGITGLERYFR